MLFPLVLGLALGAGGAAPFLVPEALAQGATARAEQRGEDTVTDDERGEARVGRRRRRGGPYFELPPEPRSRRGHWAGEARLEAAIPVHRDPVCPTGAECLMDAGGGVGGFFEFRWPRGITLGVGYDLLLHDGNAVFEITTLQVLKVGVRFILLRERFVHPTLAFAAGPALFGDTFAPDAFGGELDVSAGLEVELTESLAFSTTLTARMFSVSAFTSPRDGVRRSESFGPNTLVTLTGGLVLLIGK